jgi:hypothetical protein
VLQRSVLSLLFRRPHTHDPKCMCAYGRAGVRLSECSIAAFFCQIPLQSILREFSVQLSLFLFCSLSLCLSRSLAHTQSLTLSKPPIHPHMSPLPPLCSTRAFPFCRANRWMVHTSTIVTPEVSSVDTTSNSSTRSYHPTPHSCALVPTSHVPQTKHTRCLTSVTEPERPSTRTYLV